MSVTAETIQAGQWLRHLTNAPERPWRHLDEIAPDPFGNPDVVVLKFSNGDGDRLHRDHLKIVNDAMFDSPARRMWEVSDAEPTEGVATERTASQWLATGLLVELTERSSGGQRWTEATLDDSQLGVRIVEIPADVPDDLRERLVPGARVEVVVPPLPSGVPGITEIRVGDRSWSHSEGVPVSRGFLDAYDLVTEADSSGWLIVAIAHLDRQPLR